MGSLLTAIPDFEIPVPSTMGLAQMQRCPVQHTCNNKFRTILIRRERGEGPFLWISAWMPLGVLGYLPYGTRCGEEIDGPPISERCSRARFDRQ